MKNPVQQSHTKHIEVRHRFMWDNEEKTHVILEFVSTNYQLGDIFTKPLRGDRFNFIYQELSMLNLDA